MEGEAEERQHAIGEQFRFYWEEGAGGMNSRVRLIPGEMEQDNPSTTWSENSDARSMTYSAYTVRSVTSFKEQTSHLSRHATRHERRDSGLPQKRPLPTAKGERHPNEPVTRFERFCAAARHRIGLFRTSRKTG